jgi:hypothetical protein
MQKHSPHVILGDMSAPDVDDTAAVVQAMASPTATLRPIKVIWGVGGAVWAGITVLTLLWLLPYSGTWLKGEYTLSTGASAIKSALLFLFTIPCYWIAVAVGWPRTLKQRIAAILLNVGLVTAMLAWSEVAEATLAGLVDGQYVAMWQDFPRVLAFLGRLDWMVALLRAYFIPYVLGLCAIELTLVMNRQHAEALQSAELARAYAVTRMTLLSAQLQPHFLFNSLNALTELVHEDPARATQFIVRLGGFLRHALKVSSQPWVHLSTEIEGLQAYFDIQRVRFGPKLDLAVSACTQSLNLSVPSLILQPLVENAITHGRRLSEEPLRVQIDISVRSDRIHIAIHNSIPRLSSVLDPSRYGRGLANVSKRLQAAYGGEARLSVGPAPHAEGTLARLDLPAHAPNPPTKVTCDP